MTSRPDDRPEFGPGGYLPRRAAQRARKIVLREQMGLGWPAAAVAAAVLVAVVGVVFLLTRAQPPEPPFVAVGPLGMTEAPGAAVVRIDDPPTELLVLRAGGGVRVFEAPDATVVYCPDSRRLEAPGAVWNLRGRLVGGDGQSLRPLPSRLYEGELYVDPSATAPAPPAAPAGETPACAG